MKKGLTLLLSLALLAGCSPQEKELLRYSRSSFTSGFDTQITLIAYVEDEAEGDEYFALMEEAFRKYNSYFDKYYDYEGVNNIKTINDNAGIQPVEVDQEIIDLILLSKQFSEYSDNQFDITLGPVLEIWHDVREKATYGMEFTIPTTEELEAAKACTGWDKVEVDDENNTVYLTESCASLDVGSVAKGFSAERVAQILQDAGLESGIVNAGGNVKTFGVKPDGDVWRSAIESPDSSGRQFGAMELSSNQSLVTSGDYQRYFIYEDEIYHHIIDPDTLYPAKHAKAVSIRAVDSGIADICSTLFYTLTYEEGVEMLEKLRGLGYELDVVWVYDKLDEIENYDYGRWEEYYILTSDGLTEDFTY